MKQQIKIRMILDQFFNRQKGQHESRQIHEYSLLGAV